MKWTQDGRHVFGIELAAHVKRAEKRGETLNHVKLRHAGSGDGAVERPVGDGQSRTGSVKTYQFNTVLATTNFVMRSPLRK